MENWRFKRIPFSNQANTLFPLPNVSPMCAMSFVCHMDTSGGGGGGHECV